MSTDNNLMEDKTYIQNTAGMPDSYTGETISDEIDLKDILVKFWKKRLFIFIFTAIFIVLGVAYALIAPVLYTASSTIVPQKSEKNAGNLGGLASMMGVNLGSGMSGESLSPSIYPKIVKSVPFCKEIMQTHVPVKDAKEPITLYDYYSDKGGGKESENATTLFYTDSLSGEVITLSKNEWNVITTIQQNIQIEFNQKEGYLTLGYTFPEATAVAVVAQQLYNTLEKYVKDYKVQKQMDDLQFVEKSLGDARKDFLQKQANLASFQDANRGLVTATARSTERQLSSEYDVAFTVYNELAKQREQAKLAVKESTPVLTIIEPVVVPERRSEPKRAMIVLVAAFLGFVLACGWVLVKPFLKDITTSVRESSSNSLSPVASKQIE